MTTFEQEVLAAYRPDDLAGDAHFCRAIGEIQGEFLVIHPFREGNARAIKLLTDLIAAQTGRPLLVYDMSDVGRDRYIEAPKAAFKRNYGPMAEVIRLALDAAQR